MKMFIKSFSLLFLLSVMSSKCEFLKMNLNDLVNSDAASAIMVTVASQGIAVINDNEKYVSKKTARAIENAAAKACLYTILTRRAAKTDGRDSATALVLRKVGYVGVDLASGAVFDFVANKLCEFHYINSAVDMAPYPVRSLVKWTVTGFASGVVVGYGEDLIAKAMEK